MNIAVFGALGRVGKSVVEIAKNKNYDVWEIDINHSQNELKKVDVVIDFSTPTSTKQVCDFCTQHNTPLVSGVTGRNDEQLDLIKLLSNKVTVITKANFSEGINSLEKICVDFATKHKTWDCEIIEIHRKGKLDSPSGTAKSLAVKIAQAKGSFNKVTIHSLRCGSNFGKHEVVFATENESVTFTHQAENVTVFARGALSFAEDLLQQKRP